MLLSLNIPQDEDELRINIMTVAITELPEMLSMSLLLYIQASVSWSLSTDLSISKINYKPTSVPLISAP